MDKEKYISLMRDNAISSEGKSKNREITFLLIKKREIEIEWVEKTEELGFINPSIPPVSDQCRFILDVMDGEKPNPIE